MRDFSGIVDVGREMLAVFGFNEVHAITGKTAPKRESIISGKCSAASLRVIVAHQSYLRPLLLTLTRIPKHDA